jgi:hypothetical protein
MNSSPSDPQAPPRAEGQPDVEERIRQMREARVRKSLAALDRGPLVFGRRAGAQWLVQVIGAVLAIFTVWWVLARVF